MLTSDIAQSAALLKSDFVALVVVQDRHIVWANPAMHRMFGYEPNELVGQPTRQIFLDSEAYETFGREVKEAVDGNHVYRGIAPQRRKDGSTGWYEFNISRQAGDTDRLVGAIVDRTESHALSIQLQASEMRYRSVLEDQTEVISRFLPDGTFVFFNEVFCRVFGKTTDELIGKRWYPVAHPDDLPMIESKLRAISPAEPIAVIENRVYLASGELRWMQFVNRGLFGTDGSLKEIQSVGRDITSLKEAEAALRESETALERAQAVAHVGSFTMRGVEEHFSHTRETARLFDLGDRLEASFSEWFSRVHPDDRAAVEAAWRAALRGAAYDTTYRIVVRGDVVWIRALAEFTVDDQGRLIRCVGTVQDITGQKHVEDALRKSEARLEMALAASDMGWWDIDLASGKVEVDERLSGMLGYSGEALARQEFWKGLHDPRDRDRFDNDLSAHLQGETAVFSNEHRLRHKDGHWVAVEMRGKVIERDTAGHPRRMVGTLVDVTQRKRLHDEGVDLLRQIESLIRETASRHPEVESAAIVLDSLTKREIQILGLISGGLSSAQIAEHLNISVNTVSTHRQNLMSKLNLHTVAELTRFAIDHRLRAT